MTLQALMIILDEGIILDMMIHTIDSRDYILLEVIKNESDRTGTSVDFNKEINIQFNTLLAELSEKNISYQKLKNALIPQKESDKFEFAFFFDTLKIKDCPYDTPVIDYFLKEFIEFRKKSKNDIPIHSISCGDLIASNDVQIFIREIFEDSFFNFDSECYKHSSQYFVVYVNNLTKFKFNSIDESLKSYCPYVGKINCTFNNPVKTLISKVIGQSFLLNGKQIIAPKDEYGEM